MKQHPCLAGRRKGESVWFTKVAVPSGSCPQARPSFNTAGHVTGSGRHMIVGDSAEAKAIFEKIKQK